MCMQCMMGAMSAGATATGLRAWLLARAAGRLSLALRRRLTAVLVVAGILAAGAIGPSPA